MAVETTTQFVLDAIEALDAIGAQEAVAFLRMMLDCDGPDVDGVVTSLIDYDIVSPEWVERLREVNHTASGLYAEELAELREGLALKQKSVTALSQ
ncbi:hypothetical protein [uncultured Actinomyces sp.]|jgi:hypothetical protein|uniref:hypothetical protein n=1 Tax=uncultured Actinomyces sp. TaxID=249061 RepID=UPI0028E9F225|nr:hypothetical protein [uncultured Actinomyces sp.]